VVGRFQIPLDHLQLGIRIIDDNDLAHESFLPFDSATHNDNDEPDDMSLGLPTASE
jgi:hypothetical protein